MTTIHASIMDTIFNTAGADVIEQPPVIVQQQNEETPAMPPMFAVLLHNDDSTNFTFVVQVLAEVFNVNRENATRIMMAAHQQGKAVVQIVSREVAETRVAQAMAKVSSNGQGQNGRNPQAPCALTFTAEPETDGE